MSQKITRLNHGVARRIGTNRRSLTGQVAFRGGSVPFESSLERDFAMIQDFDSAVLELAAQPVRIDFELADGKSAHYTPDYLVTYWDGRQLLCEIKYRSNLWEEWAVLKPRFRAAIRYARLHGMEFRIFTEVEIRGSGYLGNIIFLRGYLNVERDEGVEEHLVRTLAVLGETTPETLLLAAFWDIENRMRAVASLWRLVATGRIIMDLHLPLTMHAPIWVVVGEGFA